MPDIYINTERPVDRSIVVGINQAQREAPIGVFVAGSSYNANLYFVLNDGTYDPSAVGVDVQVAVSTIASAQSGTFTLTDGTDTTAALDYGASAQTVEDALNALNSGTGLSLGTVSLVDVVKVNNDQYTWTARTFGAMTALSGSTTSLYPESTPTASIAVAGTSTVYAQQIIEITRQPAVFQQTWSAITNGYNGTLAMNTTRLLQSLQVDQGEPFYIEVKLDGETVAREVVGMELSNMPASAFTGATIALKSTEGANVLSTGEAGGTKFLREDGDGTSSWQEITKTTVGLSSVDNTADADKPVSTAQQAALALKITTAEPSAATGAIPQQQNAVITVKDGGAKTYNVFPNSILVGSTLYSTICPMTGHLSRDGDVLLYTAENYGAGEWVSTEIFSATGTAGAIILGDKEYRYGGLHHLGGDKLMILLHTYTVSDAGDLSAVVGNNVEWAVSSDMGNTWGASQTIPLQDGDTWLAAAGNPYLFNGRVYLGVYDSGGEHMLSQTLAEIEAGTNDNWRSEWESNGTENYLTVSPDGATLRSYSRVADIALKTTADGSTWTTAVLQGLPDWEPTQPTVEELEDGTLVHIGRQDSLGLEARLYYKPSGAGQWIINDTPLVSNRVIPAWDSIEKHTYNSIIPFGGSMFGCLYSLEADEEWNTINQSTGSRASVYYSMFASGAGLSPLNGISPVSSTFDPRHIDGCNLMLTPESLIHNGTIVTDWTDLSGAGNLVTTDSGNEPSVNLGGSPNGFDCVQGAAGKYFAFTAKDGLWPIGSLYAVFNYPNANFANFTCIIPNAIQGDGTTDNLKFDVYGTGPISTHTTVNDLAYDAATFDPTAWARYSSRSLLSSPGTGSNDLTPWAKGGLTRLMTQAGFESSRWWKGNLACMVTFDRRLTTAEDAEMRVWLNLQ